MPSSSKPPSRHIAPKLASGISRVPNVGALPPHIRRGLQMIAIARGESVSWVMEQIIYEYFGFRVPSYVGTRTAAAVSTGDYSRIVRRVEPKRKNPKADVARVTNKFLEKKGGSV